MKQSKKHSLEERLENYKKMHSETAKRRDKVEALGACRTLTQARKCLFGEKTKNNSRYRGHPNWI